MFMLLEIIKEAYSGFGSLSVIIPRDQQRIFVLFLLINVPILPHNVPILSNNVTIFPIMVPILTKMLLILDIMNEVFFSFLVIHSFCSLFIHKFSYLPNNVPNTLFLFNHSQPEQRVLGCSPFDH